MFLCRATASWQAFERSLDRHAGAFRNDKRLPEGILRLHIVIACFLICLLNVDAYGEEARGAGVSASNSSNPFGSHHALIIGIDNYHIWPKLLFAEKDASDIKNLLVNQYGVSSDRIVHLAGMKATRRNILVQFRKVCQTLGAKDQLLIYYAGHGQYDPLSSTGFWIPVEGTLYDETTWVAFSRLKGLLTSREVKVKNIILVTDSCYGGAITRSAPTPGQSTPDLIGYDRYAEKLRHMADKPSRQVIASGGFEQVPDRSEFARLLKFALRSNAYPLVDLEYLFYSKIYPYLRLMGQTEPLMTRLGSSPDLLGQFVLLLGIATDWRSADDTTEYQIPDNNSTDTYVSSKRKPEVSLQRPAPEPMAQRNTDRGCCLYRTPTPMCIYTNRSYCRTKAASRGIGYDFYVNKNCRDIPDCR